MHTILLICGGIALFGICLLLGMFWGGARRDYAMAARVFIPIWWVVAMTNMWVGVARAGYSVADELPVLGIVFAVPALLAVLAVWRLSR